MSDCLEELEHWGGKHGDAFTPRRFRILNREFKLGLANWHHFGAPRKNLSFSLALAAFISGIAMKGFE